MTPDLICSARSRHRTHRRSAATLTLMAGLGAVTPLSPAAGQSTPAPAPAAAPAPVTLALAPIFSDGVVLQRSSTARVWGFAKPGDTVTLHPSWTPSTTMPLSSTAGADGRFEFRLDTPARAASGAQFEVRSGGQTAVVRDVLFGEVWVLGGQSNMEWPLAQSEGGMEAAGAVGTGANVPEVRSFIVTNTVAAAPQTRTPGVWVAAGKPENARRMSAVGFHFADELRRRLGESVPVGLVQCEWGGTAAESWVSREALAGFAEFAERLAALPTAKGNLPPSTVTGLYNGMVASIAGYTARGVLFYQGEANIGRYERYRTLFPALVTDWRKAWNQPEWPFLFAQIAPYRYDSPPDLAAWLREAQTEALKLPRTAMVPTVDVGDRFDIHPRDKRTVGVRFAQAAAAMVYGKADAPMQGPKLLEARFVDGTATLKFDPADGQLAVSGNELKGFMLAGADRRFWLPGPDRVRIQGHTVVLSHPNVPMPVAVRYAWMDDLEGTLVSDRGWPAAPFRTDDWLAMERAPGGLSVNNIDLVRPLMGAGPWTALLTADHFTGGQGWMLTADEQQAVSVAGTGGKSLVMLPASPGDWVMELVWRARTVGARGGLLVCADDPGEGGAAPAGVLLRMDDGPPGENRTLDGDMEPLGGAAMLPSNGRKGSTAAFPTERRSNRSPMWNHWRVERTGEDLSLAVNGKVVTRAMGVQTRIGRVGLWAEQGQIEVRDWVLRRSAGR